MAFSIIAKSIVRLAAVMVSVECGRHRHVNMTIPNGASHTLSVQETHMMLFAELQTQLETERGLFSVAEFAQDLNATFVTLPKDEHGGLHHAHVRYALHRLFMRKRSWFIRGLDPDSEKTITINSSSVDMQRRQAVPVLPPLLQSYLEGTHTGMGLNLTEVAAIAATIDDFTQREVRMYLQLCYDALGLKADAILDKNLSDNILTSYSAIFFEGSIDVEWSSATILNRKENLTENATEFLATHLAFVEGLNASLWASREITAKEDRFEQIARLLDHMGEQYHEVNDKDCTAIKHNLLQMESRFPGRVRLSDFYNTSNHTLWTFVESVSYLRRLGALDESNASNIHVVIPNYVASMPQCLDVSSVHSVCCLNECEGLMLTVESALAAPEATPQWISEFVSGLSSDTVIAPRTLPQSLYERLQLIADHHGGNVPIHGRLFAQWMHQAFPRECPYPHKSGTTAPVTPDEWMKETGQSTLASDEEMQINIRHDDSCDVDSCDASLPWSLAEELVTDPIFRPSNIQRPRSAKAARKSSAGDVPIFVVSAAILCAVVVRMSPKVRANLYQSFIVRTGKAKLGE